MEGAKIPGLPNKISSCEVSVLKINNTVEHDANSVYKVLKIIAQIWQRTLLKMVPKAPNKYSINTVIKYYKHIQRSHFNLAYVSILTILK